MLPSNKSASPAANDAKPPRVANKETKRVQQPDTSRRGSKKAKIIALLKRPGGAALERLQKATGWQAHSVRGFLSGTLKKKMGLCSLSSKLPDGVRVYRIASK
jgi:hypothetical protein